MSEKFDWNEERVGLKVIVSEGIIVSGSYDWMDDVKGENDE